MSNQTTLFHGGAYEITKASEPVAGLVVEVFDMEEGASSVAPMTPAEWNAFVAAGNVALGRPASAASMAASIRDSRGDAADEHAHEGWSLMVEDRILGKVEGHAAGLRAALAMVREQGQLTERDLSQLRALVGQSPDDTFDQCIREIEKLIARLKTERAEGAQCERDEIENMIDADTSPGVLAVAEYLRAMVRARSGGAAREQGPTVPRAALAEALDHWEEAIVHIEEGISECTEPRRDLARLRALLADPPATQEKG